MRPLKWKVRPLKKQTNVPLQEKFEKMNSTKVFQLFFLSALAVSCTTTDKAQGGIKVSLHGGYARGGIIENTDLSLVPNARPTPESTVDAYTGATIGGPTVAVHINKALRFGELETGLDYMYNHQSFSYADQGNMYIGVRKLDVHQFMIPLTYNIVLFRRNFPHADIMLKLGVLGQYNLVGIQDAGLTALPYYSLNKWSGGATFGIAAYPVMFSNGSKLGFYVDAYRGSRIYTDYYNQLDFEMPGSGFIKVGLKYQFKKF